MDKLPHEWDINGFITELLNSGVEFTFELCEESSTRFSFDISYRPTFEDAVKVNYLRKKYFGSSMGLLGSD